MKRFLIFLLLCIPLILSAQDGISPDTLYNHQAAIFGLAPGDFSPQIPNVWCADTSAGDTSIFYGVPDTINGENVNFVTCEECFSYVEGGCYPIIVSSQYYLDYYKIVRHAIFFDTREIPGLTSMKQIDSVFVRFNLTSATIPDGDSLFVVKFIPRQDSTPFGTSFGESNVLQPCNFFQCSTEVWVDGDASHWGKYGVNLSVGWNQIKLEPGYINVGDTSAIGFVTRLDCSIPSGTWPTGDNNYWITYDCSGDPSIDTSAITLIYYLGAKHNDISHQNNADGISPDTIQFICSDAQDEIRTPGFWKNEFIPDWNKEEYGGLDCFHGRPRNDLYGCDSGYCASHWLRAESGGSQPLVVATKRLGHNDFWACRAYFLLELEEPIPDTTALDSMRFYMQFGSVDLADGDSVHVVSYEPRYSADGVASCYTCYSCNYPALYTPSHAWCNYWECGTHRIWGNRASALPGVVPVYLGWNWFSIHPNIIDFTAASVGDTFGVGLVMRFEDSPDPTGTNQVNIMVGGNCPYIVYWFSEPKRDADGFINWGLPAHHSNYGLPIKARRMYGGGKGR